MSPISSLLVLLLVGCAAAQFRFTTTNATCSRLVQWNRLSLPIGYTIPPRRFDPAVVVDPTTNTLFVSGGTTATFSALDDSYQFNPATGNWTVQADIPIGTLSDHSATFIEGSLYIFGGKGENGISNETLVYTIANNSWSILDTSTDRPSSRFGHSAQYYNGKLYIFAGEGVGKVLNNEVWSLDLTTLVWTKHTSTQNPFARLWHSTVLLNNKWILYGGYNGASGVSDVWSYDFATSQWTQISATSPLDPRSGHVAVVLEGLMFVIGGEYDTPSGLILNNNDVWSFDPTNSEWMQWCSVGTSIHPRLGARGDVATLAGTTGALIFGGVITNVVFDELYVWNDLWAMSLVPEIPVPPVYVPVASPNRSNSAASVTVAGVAVLAIVAALI